MARSLPKHFSFILILWAFFITASPATAFYEWQEADRSLYFGGFFRLAGTGVDYPDDTSLYEEEDDFLWDTDVRVLLDGSIGDQLFLKANLLQTVRSTSLLNSNTIFASPLTVQRSFQPAMVFCQCQRHRWPSTDQPGDNILFHPQ